MAYRPLSSLSALIQLRAKIGIVFASYVRVNTNFNPRFDWIFLRNNVLASTLGILSQDVATMNASALQ